MPHAEWTAQLLAPYCERVFFSCRADQVIGDSQSVIRDREADQGPMGGLLSAHEAHPNVAWLVVACDLPNLDDAGVRELVAARSSAHLATVYLSLEGQPEPLCAVYEPAIFAELSAVFAAGQRCPRRLLASLGDRVRAVKVADPRWLDNANTPQDAARYGSL
jgi:molybdopterin-guanine dinucleotide biosynthesis protein A